MGDTHQGRPETVDPAATAEARPDGQEQAEGPRNLVTPEAAARAVVPLGAREAQPAFEPRRSSAARVGVPEG